MAEGGRPPTKALDGQQVECLGDLGEWQLIERLGRFAPPGQFSDDAALLSQDRGTLVINTDVLVEGVHFSEATTDPVHVGWRAATANLSDLAAMGCSGALGLTVGLVAPAATPWPWVEGVYEGLQGCLQSHSQGGVLLGGDCSSGTQRLLAVTALGRLQPLNSSTEAAIRRGDGRPGDWLVSSGPHGLSRLGLALLRDELPEPLARNLPDSLRQRAITAHRQPRPRFDAVMALHASRPPHCPWRVAGTDSSDGLAAASRNIALASGCRVLLDQDALPIEPALADLAQGQHWCLCGGEDFELVLALEPGWAEALLAGLPGSRRIGRLTAADTAGSIGWQDPDLSFPDDAAGFCHFRG
jgi:thiamine-monophosphate kinase